MIVYEEKSVIKAAEQLFLLCGKDFRIVIDTSHNPLNANLAKPLACFCPTPIQSQNKKGLVSLPIPFPNYL